MRAIKTKLIFLLFVFLVFDVFSKPKQQEPVDVYETVKTESIWKINKGLSKDKGAINRRYGENGDTLLMVALENARSKNIIELLLDFGADIDATNNNGDTAIIYALKYNAGYKILKTLINYDARKAQRKERVAHKNNIGQSATDFAKEGSKEMKVLQKYIDKPKQERKALPILKNHEIPDKEANRIEESYEEKIAEVESDEKIAEVESDENGTDFLTNENDEKFFEELNVDINDYVIQEKQEESKDTLDEEFSEEFPLDEDFSETPSSQESADDLFFEDENTLTFSKEEEEEILASKEAAEEALKKRRDPTRRMYLFEGFEAFETYDDSQEPEEPIKQPNKQDKDGRTLLQTAASNDDLKLIDALIKAGADINLVDNDSWTPLMYAARFAQKRETISTLLNNGADIKAKNRFGITALQIAASFNTNPEIVDELAKNSLKRALKPSFIAAVGLGRERKILEVFFNYGITPNIVYKGKTPLMYAAEFNTDTNCIEFLLKNGADKTFITADRKDAYYFASKNPNLPHNKIYWSLNNSGN